MLLFSILVFALVEGVLSVSTVASHLLWDSQPVLAERQHTEYDSELGWVSLPDVHIEALYGPGLSLTTNSQGFRALQDFEKAVPEGKLRAVCTGDSFTLGYGVANEQTWCAQLENLDPRIESVNMGQGGYGVGQAYLWYMRDAGVIDHDLHLFSFIYGDFQRMGRSRFAGYHKPLVTLVDGWLEIENVPVPRRGYFLPWFRDNAPIFRELRSVDLLSSLLGDEPGSAVPFEVTFSAAMTLFERLRDRHKAAGSSLVLVYLPVEEDVMRGDFDGFRTHLQRSADRLGITLIDLTDDVRSAAPSALDSLFIPEGESDFPDASGHYSAFGNKVVAEQLLRRLHSLPVLARKLTELEP